MNTAKITLPTFLFQIATIKRLSSCWDPSTQPTNQIIFFLTHTPKQNTKVSIPKALQRANFDVFSNSPHIKRSYICTDTICSNLKRKHIFPLTDMNWSSNLNISHIFSYEHRLRYKRRICLESSQRIFLVIISLVNSTLASEHSQPSTSAQDSCRVGTSKFAFLKIIYGKYLI